MRKGLYFMLAACLFVLTMAVPQASAQVADGTHTVSYQVNQPNSSSASIANDYFLKPAKVTVAKGVATVELTLKNSAWITKFEPPGGAKVLNENKAADTRTVQFSVGDLSKPVTIAMKVDVDDINYHHEYSVDLVFDEVAAAAPPVKSETATPAPTKDKTTDAPATVIKKPATDNQVKNPQTSDSTPYLLIFALVGSAVLLYKTRYQRKQGEQS